MAVIPFEVVALSLLHLNHSMQTTTFQSEIHTGVTWVLKDSYWANIVLALLFQCTASHCTFADLHNGLPHSGGHLGWLLSFICQDVAEEVSTDGEQFHCSQTCTCWNNKEDAPGQALDLMLLLNNSQCHSCTRKASRPSTQKLMFFLHTSMNFLISPCETCEFKSLQKKA